MKLGYIFPNFFFIGAQRAAAATLRTLDTSRYQAVVFVVDPNGEMKGEIPKEIAVHSIAGTGFLSRVPFFRIFSWPFQLRKQLKKTPVDCIISICPQTNFTLVLYKLFFKDAPILIGEEHQHLSNAIKNDPRDFKRPWKYLYRFSLRNYHLLDQLRCVSKAAAHDFEVNWGVPGNKISTVYPAFDLDRILYRSHGQIANNRVSVVCSVGRLTSQKDFGLLIRAFSQVRQKLPATLRIAGAGPEMGNLQELIAQLGLNDSVELLGFVEFAEEIIASSDLFVMTSVWEGFPATLVESMVLGTAVVSVDCESGPAELIDHGVNGYLVKERTAEAVAQGIIDMLTNPTKRTACSKAAKEKVTQFSLPNTVAELQSLIERLN